MLYKYEISVRFRVRVPILLKNSKYMSSFNNVTFNITISMNDACINKFIGMLMRMAENGRLGHSEWVAFYSDGDGIFRPEIKIEGLDAQTAKILSERGKDKKITAVCFDPT